MSTQTKELIISNNERDFILKALTENQLRVDGRGPYDFRQLEINFGKNYGHAEVKLGKTHVLGVVSYEVVEPYVDRPTEGFLLFNTELSPMASAHFESGRPSEMAIELSRVIDRSLRGSRAIDTEALCIVAGQKVWSIRVDLHVLDHYGNLIDVCHIAAIAALLHFRRPEVTIQGEEVIIHTMEERDPIPLSIHHIPICISFAFLDEDVFCVDPSLKEEIIAQGTMTGALNTHGEICAIQKAGGMPLTSDQIMRCVKIAAVKTKEITDILKSSLDKDAQNRKLEKLPEYAKPGTKQKAMVEQKPEEDDDDEISDISDISTDTEEEEEKEEIQPKTDKVEKVVVTSNQSKISDKMLDELLGSDDDMEIETKKETKMEMDLNMEPNEEDDDDMNKWEEDLKDFKQKNETLFKQEIPKKEKTKKSKKTKSKKDEEPLFDLSIAIKKKPKKK